MAGTVLSLFLAFFLFLLDKSAGLLSLPTPAPPPLLLHFRALFSPCWRLCKIQEKTKQHEASRIGQDQGRGGAGRRRTNTGIRVEVASAQKMSGMRCACVYDNPGRNRNTRER